VKKREEGSGKLMTVKWWNERNRKSLRKKRKEIKIKMKEMLLVM
jgi:hypothetical protein